MTRELTDLFSQVPFLEGARRIFGSSVREQQDDRVAGGAEWFRRVARVLQLAECEVETVFKRRRIGDVDSVQPARRKLQGRMHTW